VEAPKAPGGLIIRPTAAARSAWDAAVKQVWPDGPPEDYAVGDDRPLLMAMERLEGPMFDVLAVEERTGTREQIGTLTQTTDFVASSVGDKMFFRHPIECPREEMLP